MSKKSKPKLTEPVKAKPCEVWAVVDSRTGEVRAVRMFRSSLEVGIRGPYDRFEAFRLVPLRTMTRARKVSAK